MIVLSVNSVSFSVGADDILTDVSFSVKEGDRLGIVGVNGAGKSTLLKIITGRTEPTSGSVFLKKDASVAMLDQNEGVSGEKTPYEELQTAFGDLTNIEKRLDVLSEEMRGGSVTAEKEYHDLEERFSARGGYAYKSRIRGVLRSLGFDADSAAPCSRLSGGQKTRLALAKVLLRDPDVMILDEPTNHLDTATLKWLEDYLAQFRKTLIVVSHDRYFLDRLTTHTLDIERGKAKLYSGGYTEFVKKKKTDREIAERHYINQQREIKRIEEYIALQRKWNRERNIIAAESRQKMLDRMVRLDKPQGELKTIAMRFESGIPSGEDVLTVKDLSKSYGSHVLFSGLSFEVKRGDRLFIIGHNGCGKSTLMKILMQRIPSDTGVCAYGYNLTIGYFDQENQNLDPQNTVLDELWNTDVQMTQMKVRSALALFRFTGDDVGKRVSVLSGGERARLTFSKLILKEHNLLLLDEPSNHLDLSSKEVLEEALSDYDGTLVCVSHDRYFIDKLSTKILDFDGPDGAPFLFDGTYAQYLRFRENARSNVKAQAEAAPPAEGKQAYLDAKRSQAEKRKNKARYEKALSRAREIEERLSSIEEDEKAHESNYVRLSELHDEKQTLEEALLTLYEEIEEYEKNGPA